MVLKRIVDKCVYIWRAFLDACLPASAAGKRMRKRLLRKSLKAHKDVVPLIENNRKYKNIHQGKRCFIIGNGPSLKQTDLSLLKNEMCFTVNFLNMSPLFERIPSCYHVMADPSIFSEYDPDRDKALDLIEKIRKRPHPTTLFLDSRIQKNGLEKGFLEGVETVPILVCDDWLTDYNGWNPNLTEPMHPFQNVVQISISIAIYMGFSEIYLLGCDATDFLNAADYKLGTSHGTHAYDEEIKVDADFVERFRLESAFYSYYRTFKDYRLLDEYCKKNNIFLANCTVGGVLDNVPRRKLEEVINT